jgi:single-stranded DNA-specific DHH superfamily exonuclease
LVAFSGRGAGTFSFASFISDPGLRNVVINMGGHAKAMGGAFKPDRLDDFIAAVRAWEQSTQGQSIWADTTEPPPAPHDLAELAPELAFTLARALGPFGHHFRRPAHRTTLRLHDGRAYSRDTPVHANVPLPGGPQTVTFTFDEARCDGEQVGINVLPA